jgi:hypothetical protein
VLPPTPQQVAVGAVVEIEGAYYAVEPTANPEPEAELQLQTPNPEQEKISLLEAEDVALDFLGRAQATNKTISNMTRGQTRLRLEGKNQAEQTRLGEAIEASGKNRLHFRRVAKKHFGLSRGIETEEIVVSKTIEAKGVEEQVIEVVATEPERQAELVESHKLFLKEYEDKPARRKTRSTEIAQEIAALKVEADTNPVTEDTTPGKLGRVAVNEAHDAPEEAPRPLTDVVYMDGDAVQLETLVSPEFDPEQVLTMTDYLIQIGTRMTIAPREDSTEDSALNVHRKDFTRAAPAHVAEGLYWTGNRERPEKLVVKVREWYCDLDRSIYRGIVPFSTDVTVSEELFEAIVGSPPWFSNKIANRTEKANENPVVEKAEDLGGESALYALAAKHLLLEEYDVQLLDERRQLVAVRNNLNPSLPINPKRVKNLESYRLAAITAIQTMVRLSGKVRGYGTNEAQDTWNAVFSETHRSREAPRNFITYAGMAINYNDAVRGKINQSIHGIGREVAVQAPFAIHNIDRVYTD